MMKPRECRINVDAGILTLANSRGIEKKYSRVGETQDEPDTRYDESTGHSIVISSKHFDSDEFPEVYNAQHRVPGTDAAKGECTTFTYEIQKSTQHRL